MQYIEHTFSFLIKTSLYYYKQFHFMKLPQYSFHLIYWVKFVKHKVSARNRGLTL